MVLEKKNPLGKNGLNVPPIIFGTSALGNLYKELSHAEKRDIVEQALARVAAPVVFDSAGKYGAGLALENLGKILKELDVPPGNVMISNKLAFKRVPLTAPEPTFEPGIWRNIKTDAVQRISYQGILECWEQGCELLQGYKPRLVSVHDPEEFLADVEGEGDRLRRLDELKGAYRALGELKFKGEVQAIGVGCKDWKLIREISTIVDLDWVMFACRMTLYTHPFDLLEFMGELTAKGVGIINSAVFNSGFLTGGEYFDYRIPDQAKEAHLFKWREKFHGLCRDFDIPPAGACVEFGLSHPGTAAVSLNTSKSERVKSNVELVQFHAPAAFWNAMKSEGLIADAYPFLPLPEAEQ